MTPQDVRAEFEAHWPKLKKALKRAGPTHTKEHVWQRVADGRAQFWTQDGTAVLTSIEKYDSGLTEVHIWLCGGSLDGAVKIEDRIAKWATGLGIDRIAIVGREGWKAALPGYRQTAVVLMKDLKR